jgi:ABC-type polysaccharide/polyol phosphate export permease
VTLLLPPLGLPARRRRIAGVILRDMAAMRRSPVRFFEIFFWPTVSLVLWGFVTRYLQGAHVPFVVSTLLGAALLWEVLNRSASEVALGFLEDVWSRNLLNVQVTPLSSGEYLAGLVGFAMAKTFVATVMMGVLAYALYGFGVFSLGVGLVPFMGLLLVMGWALAIVSISCVLRYGQGAQVIGWSLVFVFQPFAGVFYPVSTLPAPMRAVSAMVPAAHVFEGMRAVLDGRPVPWGELGSGALLDVVYLGLALWLFHVTLRNARVRGRLARFGE